MQTIETLKIVTQLSIYTLYLIIKKELFNFVDYLWLLTKLTAAVGVKGLDEIFHLIVKKKCY